MESFKYLGTKIHKSGRNDAEINDRIENVLKVFFSLNNTFIRKKEVSICTKMMVYKSIFRPILIYGSESWVLAKRTSNKLQAIEMKYLRAVIGIILLKLQYFHHFPLLKLRGVKK